MRILVLHSTYLSGPVSGENRVVGDEITLLREGGHNVESWTPSVEGESVSDLMRIGVETIWSRRAARRVRSLVEGFKPDVVHCHNLFPALSPSIINSVAASVPTVMTLHNFRLMCLPATFLRDGRVCEDCLGRIPWRGVAHKCYRGSLPASFALATSLAFHRAKGTFDKIARFAAVSRFLREKYLQAGWPEERVVVKPNFAWDTEIRRDAGDYFLYAGRISPEKGIGTVTKAWGAINAKLRIVGEGPDKESLPDTEHRNIDVERSVAPKDVASLLRGARALLLPSESYEGMPRIVLEAFAAGVPVIASRIGGLPELIRHGESGLLATPGDTASWIDMVNQLKDDQLSIRLGSGARRAWQQNYSPDRAIVALEQVYRAVL